MNTVTSGFSLIQKMFNITEDAQAIPKDGYNSFSKYAYVKADDVIEATKKLMLKHGVYNTVEYNLVERKKEEKNFHTIINIFVVFYDVTNPEDQLKLMAVGVAADTLDKDLYKAITNALKYVYISQFKLPVGLEDVEQDEIKQPTNQTKSKQVETNFSF